MPDPSSAPAPGGIGSPGAGAAQPGGAPDRSGALTEERLLEILDERLGQGLETRLHRVVNTHLKRLKSPSPPAPTQHGDDQDEDDGDEPQGGSPQPQKPASNPREQRRLKALETELATLKAERERDKADRQRLGREAALRRAVETADPVSVDDAFHVLIASPELKVSEDGTFVVEGKDGSEVALDEWAKKQIAARSHLQKPARKDGGGSVPRGSAPGGKSEFEGLTGEALIRAVRAKQQASA